jgi:hypothetical protein
MRVGFAEINKLRILWVFIFPILIMIFRKKYTKIIDFLYKKTLYYYCGIFLRAHRVGVLRLNNEK